MPETQTQLDPETQFESDEMPPVPMDDDVPFGNETLADFSGDVDYDLLKDAPKVGEVIPAGTYLFKLKGYEKSGNENGPNVILTWECKDPRYLGRIVSYDYITLNSDEMQKRAKMGDSEARRQCVTRLAKLKELREALNMTEKRDFNLFRDILNQENIECKIQIKEKEKMGKDKNGKYSIHTGEFNNSVVHYVPMLKR